MSKKNTNKNNDKEYIAGSLKTENYLSSLQNENNLLNTEIRKLNDIVIKLKSQLSNYEKEKKNLISNSTKKENDLKELKKKINSNKKGSRRIKTKNGPK
jgi:predicted  nucleic acid-binding Zn-ribbon protein